MYLIDYAILLKQILPPHWRGTWREHLIRSLMEPVIADYNDFYDYIYSIPQQVNLNSQVMVMEETLNRLAGHLTRLIYIDDSPQNGSFVVNIPAGDPALYKIIEFLDQYSIAGKSYTLNEY